MTAAERLAHPNCEVSKVPDPSSVENHAALYKAIDRAVKKTAPAVYSNGVLVTPAKTATVFIPPGRIKLSRPIGPAAERQPAR